MGIDFGFGSSKSAIVMTEHVKTLDLQKNQNNDKIIVRFAEEHEKENPQTIAHICHSLHVKHWNTIFFVDGSNRAGVNLLKVAFDESLNWEPNDVNPELMKIILVNFTSEHKKM